jgi:uroporphyrinogen-III synthase
LYFINIFVIGEKTRDALKGMGIDVNFVGVPNMPHTATEEELVHVGRFINQQIPPT